MKHGRHFLTAALVLILTSVALEAKCGDVLKPSALYLSLSAADLSTTALAMQNGASEGNPWMRSRAIEKQVALTVALTVVDTRLKRRAQKRAFRLAVTVVRLGAIGWNIRNARR